MTGDLAFLHFSHYPDCRARVDKHFDDYFSFQFLESGAVELFYDDEFFDLRGGGWFWPAFPGPRIRFHSARDVSTWNHRYAAFRGPRVASWKNAGIWPQKPQRAPRLAQNIALFDEILELIRRGTPLAHRRAVHGLESLFWELCDARDTEGQALASEQWLQSCRDFLRETRDFSPNYEALARELGMGLSTLRRKFKAATGVSLHEALLQNRLDNARQLLGETDLPLKAVAHEAGYANVHFFSNQFKARIGVSPALYRRSRQI